MLLGRTRSIQSTIDEVMGSKEKSRAAEQQAGLERSRRGDDDIAALNPGSAVIGTVVTPWYIALNQGAAYVGASVFFNRNLKTFWNLQ